MKSYNIPGSTAIFLHRGSSGVDAVFARAILSATRIKCVLLFIVVGISVFGITGCTKYAPVSSNTSTEHKKDSVSSNTKTKTDSSSLIETVTEKTLLGATVGFNAMTPIQFDSLFKALSHMPTSVTRTIVQSDPNLRAQLTIALDSLGRISLKCRALDYHYYEKSVQQTRFIESLTHELTKTKEENATLKELVKVKKPGFFESIKKWWRTVAITAGVIIALYMLARWAFKRFIGI